MLANLIFCQELVKGISSEKELVKGTSLAGWKVFLAKEAAIIRSHLDCNLQGKEADQSWRLTVKAGQINLFSQRAASVLFAVLQLFAGTVGAQINMVDLEVTSKDLQSYRLKSERYDFENAQWRLNGGAWVPLEDLHTRGQSSLSARRRNFGLELPVSVQINEIHAKKINLLSMWADRGYISSKLGLLTAEHLQIGIPLPTVYTEVRLNNSTNGLYLAVETPKAAAKKSPYIVRRGYGSRFLLSEAKASDQLTPTQVRDITRALSALYANLQSKSGSKLFEALNDGMDLDAYMKWMTINSLYRNGDGPDEVFFYVDPEKYATGKIYFRIMPWDFDDLFKAMHSPTINKSEIAKNPNSLLYNFEDKLDLAFARDSFLYEQLKQRMKLLLNNELASAQTDILLQKIQSEIAPYLERDDVLAMGRLDGGRNNKPYTKKEILEMLANRKSQIDQRRQWLLQRMN